MDAHGEPRLVLEANASSVELTRSDGLQGAVVTLGKDDTNDVIHQSVHTSRHHAFVEAHRDSFYLIDRSTNGTFVQTEDEQIRYVHRGRLRLWGSGWISLGEPLHLDRTILFREAG